MNDIQLNGLVLVGGKSTRMGQDKGSIMYHDKTQREYAYDLLQEFCDEVFVSCRKDQLPNMTLPAIADRQDGLGAFGAIISAFQKHPGCAWLIMACDMPLVSKETLQYLVENRNPKKYATALKSPDKSYPEPLLAIWEPRIYIKLAKALASGDYSPKKILTDTELSVKTLDAPNPDELFNVNSPDELDKVMKQLGNQGMRMGA